MKRKILYEGTGSQRYVRIFKPNFEDRYRLFQVPCKISYLVNFKDKEETMTKQEKIDALRKEMRQKYEAFDESPTLNPSDIEDAKSWISFRAECENEAHVSDMCHEIPTKLAYKMYEDINNRPGEYEVFCFVKRVGDIDTSEAGEERRKKVHEFNKQMHKYVQVELAKIELEFAEKEATQ